MPAVGRDESLREEMLEVLVAVRGKTLRAFLKDARGRERHVLTHLQHLKIAAEVCGASLREEFPKVPRAVCDMYLHIFNS